MAEGADGIKFTTVKFLQQALYTLQDTGLYKDKVKDWKKKTIADKTWKVLRTYSPMHTISSDRSKP